MKWSGVRFTEALNALMSMKWTEAQFEELPKEAQQKINEAIHHIERGLDESEYLRASQDAGCYSTKEGFRVVLRDTPMISVGTHEDCWADITPERAFSMGKRMVEDAEERILRDKDAKIRELQKEIETLYTEMGARDAATE